MALYPFGLPPVPQGEAMSLAPSGTDALAEIKMENSHIWSHRRCGTGTPPAGAPAHLISLCNENRGRAYRAGRGNKGAFRCLSPCRAVQAQHGPPWQPPKYMRRCSDPGNGTREAARDVM